MNIEEYMLYLEESCLRIVMLITIKYIRKDYNPYTCTAVLEGDAHKQPLMATYANANGVLFYVVSVWQCIRRRQG